jgi:enoyl-CoA hydratase/carnithine racemase
MTVLACTRGQREVDSVEDQRFEQIMVTAEAGIAEVTLNRPDRYNAALNGLAFGGGLEIALACDFRLAAEGARFALPEVGIGIVPGAGGTQRLPRLIGVTRAKELILTGRRISTKDALDIGLVSKAVSRSSLMEEARSLAQEIAANSPLALAYAKAAVDLAAETTIEQGTRYETAAIRATLSSDDYKLGLAAFAERRTPVFPPLTSRRIT